MFKLGNIKYLSMEYYNPTDDVFTGNSAIVMAESARITTYLDIMYKVCVVCLCKNYLPILSKNSYTLGKI